jgi:hypothetical protein
LDHTKTIEDAKKKLPEIAHILKKPRSQVHISETDAGVEGEVQVTVLDNDPFASKDMWQGAEYPGDSIVTPISFATYDTGERGQIFIAGKNGASSEHFLTVGMPGTGKSKVWQAIYGTVLTRKEVSVIYGDPAKGMQTGGPLAQGLDWFAWTESDCKAQIKAVMNAIPERTNYLTSKGLSHWQSGCGLNFLIFHLEEAARFAEVSDLIVLLEAARSAGIAVVVSLQRATHDRIPTSARYNLGANLCFGVKGKRDAEFGLSEYARESGAAPHIWQNRFPGRFYLESTGIDQRLAGHPLQADWINESHLESVVDAGMHTRSIMDSTTASALGNSYALYRRQVDEGTTAWQDMRRNRNFHVDTKDWPVDTDTLTEQDLQVIDAQPFEKAQVRNNLNTDPEDTQRAINEFDALLRSWVDNGKYTFVNKEISQVYTLRSSGWISKRLKLMQQQGKLEKTDQGFWRIISL